MFVKDADGGQRLVLELILENFAYFIKKNKKCAQVFVVDADGGQRLAAQRPPLEVGALRAALTCAILFFYI